MNFILQFTRRNRLADRVTEVRRARRLLFSKLNRPMGTSRTKVRSVRYVQHVAKTMRRFTFFMNHQVHSKRSFIRLIQLRIVRSQRRQGTKFIQITNTISTTVIHQFVNFIRERGPPFQGKANDLNYLGYATGHELRTGFVLSIDFLWQLVTDFAN